MSEPQGPGFLRSRRIVSRRERKHFVFSTVDDPVVMPSTSKSGVTIPIQTSIDTTSTSGVIMNVRRARGIPRALGGR